MKTLNYAVAPGRARARTRFRALGITSGIGSMLASSAAAGFEIVGNVEWRNYYRAVTDAGDNTFLENFPGAVLANRLEHLTAGDHKNFHDVDLVMSHPECGAYSRLQVVNRDLNYTKSDIPLAMEMVNRFQPKFFVLDEMPKSLLGVPISEWAAELPGYRLFPEWISNYHYGNSQRHRQRMFMIGARDDQDFVFVPGEQDLELTLADALRDLPREAQANELPYMGDKHRFGLSRHVLERDTEMTYRQMFKYVAKMPRGETLTYFDSNGDLRPRLGVRRMGWDHPAYVLTGGANLFHPEGRLFTIRERARIQGFPDSFVFHGLELEDDGTWLAERNGHMHRQTGKAMPLQFTGYAARQIMAHLEGKPWKVKPKRVIAPHPLVSQAKLDYCKAVGYASGQQERACQACWLQKECTIRSSRAAPPEELDALLH